MLISARSRFSPSPRASLGFRLQLGCALVFLPLATFAADHSPPVSQPGEGEASAPSASPEVVARHEIDGYLRLAQTAADQAKWPLAEHYLDLMVNVRAPEAEKKSALRALAATYEKQRVWSKAIAIYEKIIALFPLDPGTPETLFQAGMLYRETGMPQRAISRFYSVINSALKVDEEKIAAQRALTLRAQKEIAATCFETGDYAQAAKFYDLLSRLNLSAEDRAPITFKKLHCQYLLGDLFAAVASAEKFLADFGTDAAAAECRYILATALRAQKRPKEALEVALALLRAEHARKKDAPEKWAYWQKKTGNEFANECYQRGDFANALTIYQTLARLSDEPAWQWPVIFQMGLCFEQLKLPKRAAEAYKFIVEEAGKPAHAGKPLPDGVADLVKSARWHGEQLAWHDTTASRLQRLLGAPITVPFPAPVTATAQASAHAAAHANTKSAAPASVP